MKHTVETARKKNSQSSFILNNFKNYIKFSTPKELAFDCIVPIILSTLTIIIVALIIPTPRGFAEIIKELNSIIITIIAILAGFNTASLTIIASSAKSIFSKKVTRNVDTTIPEVELKRVKKLINLIKNNPSGKELDAVISFFAYAVISQLLILVISLIVNIILSSSLKIESIFPSIDLLYKQLILIVFSSIWVSLVLHSIFLSIRNIDIISHFIKFSSHEDDPTSK
ncbi:hypothetical protein U2I53_05535 [Lysinibacillus capsici]|uniref:hypothetical protein n=1 Tax=Lysinibacillus capsici TaxID=2115968 RepID=UPI0032E04435